MAVASAAPSIRPTVSMLTPRAVTMKTGSRLWIISEEMSMSRLTNPRAQIPAGRRLEGEAVGAMAGDIGGGVGRWRQGA